MTRMYEMERIPMTTAELIEKLKTQHVSNEDILRALRSDCRNFGIIMKFYVRDDKKNVLGCEQHVSKHSAIAQLTTTFDFRFFYGRHQSNPFVTFVPDNKECRNCVVPTTYSFRSFCDAIRDGSIRLYDRAQ